MSAQAGRVGSTIQGRYHLVRQLGDGGMGAVYKAADQVLRRFVAVKLLHPAVAQNPSAVERFVREARAAAGIGQPNIIDILDFGREQGQPFLVMEYLRGRSLSNAIAHESPFAVARACSIATHALAGLAAAHGRGILHRDLKPANLMLVALFGDRDFVKICDFGFATLLTPRESINDGKSLTPARTLVGTPAYAAPERLRGDDRPDARMDVYSIGVVLYEMLVGRRPFDAPTFAELAQKVKTQEPPAIRKQRPEIPKQLEDVVMHALAKQREDRFPTAEAFAAALVPFGGRRIQGDDDEPSDSFTMDLLKLRARETTHKLRTSQINDESGLGAAVQRALAASEPPPPRESSHELLSVDVDISIEEDNASTGGTEGRRIATDHGPKPIGVATSAARNMVALDTHVDPRVGVARFVEKEAARREVSGAALLGVMRYVTTRFSPRALKDVLAGLPAGVRPIFQRGISEHDWVPFAALETLQQQVDTKLGRDDMHLVLQCGRGAAEGTLPRLFETVPKGAPPEVLLAEMPRFMEHAVRGVRSRVRTVGRGYGSLEVLDDESDHALSTCVSLLGFFDRSFAECAAKEVEVTSVSCRALGDAQCVFDLSWLA